MSKADRVSAAQRRTLAVPPPAAGPLLVATVVRADGDGVWAHVDGEVQDRGPLRGVTAGLSEGDTVLIAIPANVPTPWRVG